MGKVDFRKLTREQRDALKLEFLSTFSKLGLTNDGQNLLADLVTESEVTMLTRRIRIAKRLAFGRTFQEIAYELGVSFNTIRMVDRWLDAALPAYRNILGMHQRKKTGKSSSPREPFDPLSFRGLRKRYPSHFALINLLLGD